MTTCLNRQCYCVQAWKVFGHLNPYAKLLDFQVVRLGFLKTFVRKNTWQRLTSQFLHFLIWYPQCRILAMVYTCGRFTSLVTLGQTKQDFTTGSAIDKSIVVGEGRRVTCAEVRDRPDGTSFKSQFHCNPASRHRSDLPYINATVYN